MGLTRKLVKADCWKPLLIARKKGSNPTRSLQADIYASDIAAKYINDNVYDWPPNDPFSLILTNPIDIRNSGINLKSGARTEALLSRASQYRTVTQLISLLSESAFQCIFKIHFFLKPISILTESGQLLRRREDRDMRLPFLTIFVCKKLLQCLLIGMFQ